jgi:GMP synthase (glutamine-hydrolysing)
VSATIRYLLLQVRNADDPMRGQEQDCFIQSLGCEEAQISICDLLYGVPDTAALLSADVILIGGSGDYSVTSDSPWLDFALDLMRRLHDEAKPTFASCWGFQAMARALGGEVVKDLATAELGTHTLSVTEAGKNDPLFGPLKPRFRGLMGHEDRVDRLPAGAVLLASSEQVENQAYRFEGKPIYCTQFHPELGRDALLERVLTYPQYIERIAGMPPEQFAEMLEDTPETEDLIRDFVQLVCE